MEVELPDEEKVEKLYTFEFDGIEQPVIIHAYNRIQARELMKAALRLLPTEYSLSKVIGETVSTLVAGASTLKVDGVDYIWAGKDKSDSGWLTALEYKNVKEY